MLGLARYQNFPNFILSMTQLLLAITWLAKKSEIDVISIWGK
jgi:hypothetical protein